MSTHALTSRMAQITDSRSDGRSSLLKLYLGRGVLAVAWAAAFAANKDPWASQRSPCWSPTP
ncbi:hypothetical protein ACFV7R_43245 [Streptomyces sp. NPDC059866]|uniref:hypothetical protein n=1 Tax=Streptomyces sp. NPDC059866 TaxID=3346978 RepID=UPI0036635907